MNNRPSKTEYYLNIAKEVATRASCLRRKFGAVIVNNDIIVSTGYNGSPRGCKDSLEAGWCYREEHNIPSGEQYEKCRSVHSEMNAIIFAGREKTMGAVLYLYGINSKTGENDTYPPCLLCTKILINAGIKKVVYKNKSNEIIELFTADLINIFSKTFENKDNQNLKEVEK